MNSNMIQEVEERMEVLKLPQFVFDIFYDVRGNIPEKLLRKMLKWSREQYVNWAKKQ